MGDERLANVDLGPLSSVVAVAQVAEVGGIRIELLTVEFRRDGGIIEFRVEDRRGSPGRTDYGPDDLDLVDPVMTLVDADGTNHKIESRSMEGTSFEVWRFRSVFAPKPLGALPLTFAVAQFGDPALYPQPKRVVAGPWVFSIQSFGVAATDV